MKTNRFTLIIVAIAVLVSMVACGSLTFAQPTATPLPTYTPQPTYTPYPTSTPLPPTEIPQTYIIPAGTFPLDTNEDCGTDASITGIDSTGFEVDGTLSIRNGVWVLWCPGAKHTWVGTLSYEGFTFASDASAPLKFMVNSQGGYEYISGNGKVTQSDGQEITLPSTKVSPMATFSATVMGNGVDPVKILMSNGFVYDAGNSTSDCANYFNDSLAISVDVYADSSMTFAVYFDWGVDFSAQEPVLFDLINNIYGDDMVAWINDMNESVLNGSAQNGLVGNFTIYMEFFNDVNLLDIIIMPAN